MTRPEFVAILEPLAQAMRTDIDKPTWSAYFRALEDVPAGLLARVVERLLREPLTFFPKAGELRSECEKQRRAMLALHPYEGCPECEHSRGFREIKSASGQMVVGPCPCKARYAKLIAGMGMGQPIAQLPGEAEAQAEQVYPTVEQLPAPLRQQLLEQVRQRVLR